MKSTSGSRPSGLFSYCQPGAQKFRDAPGLRVAAGGRERLFWLGHFAHAAYACFPEMAYQWREQGKNRGAVVKDAQMDIDIRANQPGPDSSLVVRAVSLRGGTIEMPVIRGILGAERAQTHRR